MVLVPVVVFGIRLSGVFLIGGLVVAVVGFRLWLSWDLLDSSHLVLTGALDFFEVALL